MESERKEDREIRKKDRKKKREKTGRGREKERNCESKYERKNYLSYCA